MSTGSLNRRSWLLTAAAGLGACSPTPGAAGPGWAGDWVGDAAATGHRWRDGRWPSGAAADRSERVGLLVVGAGIAGLAAARAARLAGVEDLAVLELHEQAGGNSRSHDIDGMACPLGAHYLPVPGPAARELLDWLHEIGLARLEFGRTRFNERHLCHSPQERLFYRGAWRDGLLPPLEPGSAALRQTRRLSSRIEALMRDVGFAMPSTRAGWQASHADLDRVAFGRWLDDEGISAPELRWYLDYCCRDDYGAPADAVSAWAGIHYFASRHGFHVPGLPPEAEDEGVFTWPEGNAWLVRRLAAPLADRLNTGWMVVRVREQRDGIQVEAWRPADGARRRWVAEQAILAIPLRWAHRMLESPPPQLSRAAARAQQAPWLVANLQLDRPLIDRPGVAPAWDNVVYGQSSLGYVDAMHQHIGPRGAASVLTAYHALPTGARPDLLARGWSAWSRWVVDDLAQLHRDLPQRVRRVDLARHGHAMSIPAPGVRGSEDLAALRAGPITPRLRLAHADLVGYSVFEEAFTLGDAAGAAAASSLLGKPPRRS
jgi:monoamine oxidase